MLDDLAMTPASDFERDIVEDAEMVSLTVNNINRVKEYRERVSSITCKSNEYYYSYIQL